MIFPARHFLESLYLTTVLQSTLYTFQWILLRYIRFGRYCWYSTHLVSSEVSQRRIKVWVSVPVTDLDLGASIETASPLFSPLLTPVCVLLPGTTCRSALGSVTEKSWGRFTIFFSLCLFVHFFSFFFLRSGLCRNEVAWSHLGAAHCFHSRAHCVIATEIRGWFGPFTGRMCEKPTVEKWNYCFDGFWWRGA